VVCFSMYKYILNWSGVWSCIGSRLEIGIFLRCPSEKHPTLPLESGKKVS